MVAPVTTMVTWNIWKEVTDTRGRPPRWKEDRKKQTSWLQPLQISSIHKRGQRGNTVGNMFSFAHLCGWMVRFGVRRAQTLGVSTFSLPTQNTLIHTRKLQLPFSIHPPAILFYFSGAFKKKCIWHTAKANWALWSQTRQNSSGETLTLKREITGASVCAGSRATRWKPQPPQHSLCCKTNSRHHTFAAGCAQEGCWSQMESVSKATEWRNAWVSSREAVEVSPPAGEATEASQRTMMSTCR